MNAAPQQRWVWLFSSHFILACELLVRGVMSRRRFLLRQAVLVVVTASMVVACNLDPCAAPDVSAQATLDVDRAAACPSPADARLPLGVKSVERLRGRRDVAGEQHCCYRVAYHRTPLDADVDVYYFDTFDASKAPCASAADVMAHRDAYPLDGEEGAGGSAARTLWNAPPNTTLVAVLSGPAPVAQHRCGYRVRVHRDEARYEKDLCDVVVEFEGSYDLARCPPPETRQGSAAAASFDDVDSIDPASSFGPVSHLPAAECTYDVVRSGSSADHCG